MRAKLVRLALIVPAVAGIITSCATYTSHTAKGGKQNPGVGYYLPKNLLKVDTVVENQAVKSVVLSTTDMMPDSQHFFLLRPGRSEFRKTESTIQVNQQGLLTSANVTATSQVSAIATSITDLVARFSPLKMQPVSDCEDGSYSALLDFDDLATTIAGTLPCDLSASEKSTGFDAPHKSEFDDAKDSFSGIFYRQSQPVLVEVENSSSNWTGLVFSPNNAPVRYLPAPRTFFSDGKFNATLVDGILTKIEQTNNSEILSAIELPASILDAYAEALGSVLDGTKSNAEKQVATQEALLKAQLATLRFEACMAALATQYDSADQRTEALEALGCVSN